MVEEHPIHQSINRAQQFLGGDRELVVSSGIAVFLGVFAVGTVWAIVLGILIWFAVLAGLQRAGKADPLMRKVYLRHVRYATVYPAKSGIYSRSLKLPPHWMK